MGFHGMLALWKETANPAGLISEIMISLNALEECTFRHIGNRALVRPFLDIVTISYINEELKLEPSAQDIRQNIDGRTLRI